MAKVIKSPALQIFYVKALMPFWDEQTGYIRDESPYRIMAVRPDMSLYELGIAVLSAFEFDDDHLFGFYDNLTRRHKSKVSYEFPEMVEQQDWSFSGVRRPESYNMEEYTVGDIFTRKGKKWLMLFDYGDKWTFWLSLENRGTIVDGAEYPHVIESKYDAPEQYPDYEEE